MLSETFLVISIARKNKSFLSHAKHFWSFLGRVDEKQLSLNRRGLLSPHWVTRSRRTTALVPRVFPFINEKGCPEMRKRGRWKYLSYGSISKLQKRHDWLPNNCLVRNPERNGSTRGSKQHRKDPNWWPNNCLFRNPERDWSTEGSKQHRRCPNWWPNNCLLHDPAEADQLEAQDRTWRKRNGTIWLTTCPPEAYERLQAISQFTNKQQPNTPKQPTIHKQTTDYKKSDAGYGNA